MSVFATSARASVRAGIRRACTDTCTIERTAVQSPCLIIDSNQNVPLERGHRLMELRRWAIMLPDLQTDGTPLDLTAGDILHVGSRLYHASVVNQPETYGVGITVESILLGTAVAASTRRGGKALRVGEVGTAGGGATHLTGLTAYRPFDVLLVPVAPQVTVDLLGVGDQQIAMVIIKRPVAANFVDSTRVNEDFPIARNDILVLPQGNYVVQATEPFAIGLIAVYVADEVRR